MLIGLPFPDNRRTFAAGRMDHEKPFDLSNRLAHLMLPILILTVPPVVAGGGYLCWRQGQNLVLSSGMGRAFYKRQKNQSIPPPQSLKSYTAGIFALGGSYQLAYAGLARHFSERPPRRRPMRFDRRPKKRKMRREINSSRDTYRPKTCESSFAGWEDRAL